MLTNASEWRRLDAEGSCTENRFGDKSYLITLLRWLGSILPGDHVKTFFYLNAIYKPRYVLRRALNHFYRMDHVYDVIAEFKNIYRGPFSILEFGVADGYAFTKLLFATRYHRMENEIVVHGFDTFAGMPDTDDPRDRQAWSGAIGRLANSPEATTS